MAANAHTGTIQFIQHDKQYVTIEFESGGKTRTINGSIAGYDHVFRMGDVVGFAIGPTPRGDRNTAIRIHFLYNNQLQTILQKAAVTNRFVGYLKIVDEKYFIKDAESYIIFPLLLSPWEVPPSIKKANEEIVFSLTNLDKPEKVKAITYKPIFNAAYKKAMTLFNQKETTPATVIAVGQFNSTVEILNGTLTAKVPNQPKKGNSELPALEVGKTIDVLISFLGPQKIVLERKS
jgi:hypothetical protein